MERAFGLSVPTTLEDLCDPARMALLVYDMQEAIVRHVQDSAAFVERVAAALEAARAVGVRVFFCRHLSLPVELMGVSQLRTAMAWQRVARVDEVRSLFERDAPGSQLVPEVTPRASEAVFDKFGMSMFEGTPLDMALRDCHVDTFAIVGAVLEIGIEPTVRHGSDLGYVPVVVDDACGSVEAEARERSLAGLDYTLMSLRTDTATFVDLVGRASSRAGS
jgi:biuret amidohydrolase